MSGLLQTEAYAAAQLRTFPGVGAETVSTRMATRMERQQRLFSRDVLSWFVIDEVALYRRVGTSEVMAAQMRRLLDVAAMPNVTLQILPAIAHPAGASGFVLADEAAYTEHIAGGLVYPTGETVSALMRILDTLRGECYRVSASAALLERCADQWTTGGSRVFPTPTAELA